MITILIKKNVIDEQYRNHRIKMSIFIAVIGVLSEQRILIESKEA
jgi:hypothetical protein